MSMAEWTDEPNPDPVADMRRMAEKIREDAGPSMPCGHGENPHLINYMVFDRGGVARCVKCGVVIEVEPGGVVRRG